MSEAKASGKESGKKKKGGAAVPAAATVEWDSNHSSTCCILCKAAWTFRNRRHHCRNCGRLVCESCSSHRVKLSEGSSESHRVCDTCNEILRHKREVKLQVVQVKDRNLELMLTTSLISDSLINLFYLDGSTKTVGIDETTTIAELACLACPSMSIALFEVVQDIHSPNQYKLLLPKQNVVSIIDSWQQHGQPYIKIVIPINNPNGFSDGLSNDYDADTRASFRATTLDSGAIRASIASPLPTNPYSSTPTPSPAAKSIYKVKQNSSVSSPIYLASSADLMGTSYESNRSEPSAAHSPPSVGRSPPSSPLRKEPSQSKIDQSDACSRNTSFSDAPTETTAATGRTGMLPAGRGGGGIGGMVGHNAAAELAVNQVQIQSLQAEIAAVKAELKKSQQKYDVLQAVCFKSGQLDLQKLQLVDNNGQGAAPSLAHYRSVGSGESDIAMGTLPGGSTVGTGVPLDRKLSKRSSFSWGSSYSSNHASSAAAKSSTSLMTLAEPSRRRGSGGTADDPDDASEKDLVLNERSVFSFSRKTTTTVRSSIVGSSSLQSLHDANKLEREGANRTRTNTAGTMDTTDMIQNERPNSRNAHAPPHPAGAGGRGGAVADELFSEIDGSVVQSLTTGAKSMSDQLNQEYKSVQIMNNVLQDPSHILSLNRNALNLLVRTFFCRVTEIESFCNRYCRLFDSVLHTDIITHNEAALDLDNALNAAAENAGYDVATSGADNKSDAPDPKLIIHIYHMIAAMDGVYEFLTEYHEDWRTGLKSWLLRTFEQCVQLPVVRTDELKSCVYCLQHENMILSPAVFEIIQRSIDASMHGGNHITTTVKYTFTGTSTGAGVVESTSAGTGGEGSDIVGRGQEVQYAVGMYSSSVFTQTLDNIINTYYSVIGDLLPTLPVEIDVFAVFQMKLVNIVKNYVKAVYYTHKLVIAPPELIRMVYFYDKLAQFCEKFSKTTSPHLIRNVSEMRPEVLRQCNSALVATLAEQMLKLFNSDEPAMSAEVEMLDKRSHVGDGESEYSVQSSSSKSGIHRSASGNSLAGLSKSGSVNDLSGLGGEPSNGGSGIFRCSTMWPIQLVGLLRQCLAWIPSEIDVQKKVYWCVLLLDTLQEFHVKQTNWLTQSMKANTINVGPLCKYVNNHTKFSILLSDAIEEWGAELPDKHAAALFDKVEFTCGLFMENSSTGVENIAQLLFVDMKDILKNNLFKNGWDNNVRAVMLLKSSLHRHFTFLQQHLCSAVGAGENGGPEAVQQLLIYVCECIVSIYIELLLSNASLNMNLTTISRLSEDLELITKLFDELRNKIYLSRLSMGLSPHIIETTPSPKAVRKSRMLSFGLKTKLSGRKKSQEPSPEPGKVAKPIALSEEELAGRASNTSLINVEEETKATFKLILQPLTHVVLAVQMNNQYLPDFVKTELYEDFGVSSLNIWQLIMHWRKESKEDIISAYAKLFQFWRAPSTEPQIDISSYISKVKPANIAN